MTNIFKRLGIEDIFYITIGTLTTIFLVLALALNMRDIISAWKAILQ